MKLTQKMTGGFVLGLILVMGLGREAVWGEKIKTTFSGTFTSTQIDTNEDNSPANLLNFKGQGTVLGRFSAQAITESQPASLLCILPNGEQGIELDNVQGSFVLRKESTGDLLFAEVTSQANCLTCPPAGCTFSIWQEHTITGGTGRFAGASGSTVATGIGEFLVGDPTGSFGFFTGKSEGEIDLAP